MELIVVLTRQHLIDIDQRVKALPLMQTCVCRGLTVFVGV